MVRSVNSQLPIPETGSGLEHLVVDLADARFTSDAHRNSRSGQTDDGVDIYVKEDGEWIGIQCKKTKSLSDKDIEAEISKAEGFSPQLSRYIIATTAPLDRNTQEFIRERSTENEENGKFSIDLWTWDDICRYLNNYPDILQSHYDSLTLDINSFNSQEHAGLLELSDEYFEERNARSPADCWRTGFSLAEVNAGYPFDRKGKSSDSLSGEIVSQLSQNEDLVLLGHPGSGKSTICRMVACRWQEKEDFRVFYRPSNTTTPFTVSDRLVEELSSSHTKDLVVVEDALRDSPAELFRLIQRLENDDSVKFLLDSRHQHWEESNDQPIRAGQAQATTADIKQIPVPSISETDVSRAINHFSDVTNQEVQATVDTIFREVKISDVGGDSLILTHLIDLYSGTAPDTPIEEADKDILYHSAVNAFEKIDEQKEVVVDTSILVSTLSAAGIGVTQELVHSLVNLDYSHNEISSAIDNLSGELVYGASGPQYQTRHELWCSKFLQVFLESQTREVAIERFESVVNAIFSILDDSSIRTSICEWIRRDPFPEDIDEGHYSDFFITRIFSIGLRNPNLATLFSTSEYSKIDLPNSVSKPIEIHTKIWRGVMRYNRSGTEHGKSDLELAKTEFKDILDISETDESIPKPAALNLKSLALTNLAAVNSDQANYQQAKNHLTTARELSERLGDTAGLSHICSLMGNIELKQGNLDTAEIYYREGIRHDRELYNHGAWAAKLSNLAEVKSSSGEYTSARRLTNTALQFFKNVNDKQGQAICYSRFSDIDRLEGEMEAAVRNLRHSLRLKSDTGSELEIASTLLGFARMVAGPFSRNPPVPVEDALQYAQKARTIYDQAQNRHGAAIASGTIGTIKLRLGYPKESIQLQREAIDAYRVIGDKSNLAAAYNDLAQAYLLQGKLIEVVEVSEKAIKINRELEELEQLAISLFTRGQALYKLDFESFAVQDMAESVSVALDINAYPIYVKAIDYLRDIHPDASIRYGLSLQASMVAKRRGDTTSKQYFEWKAEIELLGNYPDLYSLVH